MRQFWLALLALSSALAQTSDRPVTFRATTRLVVINVTVTDRNGRPVEDLTKDDFEITEDGKPQKIAVFEFQRLEPPERSEGLVPRLEAPIAAPDSSAESEPGRVRYRDRRLLVLYFDLASMSPQDQIRAREAAERFVREKMSPVDLVSIMVFSGQLQVLQEFTDDRDRLLEVLRALRIGEGSEQAMVGSEATQSSAEESEEEATAAEAFIPDETEFSIFNTDRRLSGLAAAARLLRALPEKKALIYFSSGVTRTGSENESQLRATVNEAVRANVAFYPVDVRGLMAEAPLGGADVSGGRGTGLFSGQLARQRRDRFVAQQETLYALAADTGGKALLDSNDLTMGIVQAQQDISSYYILGYYPDNQAEDGRYRRIRVRVKRSGQYALDYRRGYFAPKSFDRFTEADREQQLEAALLLEDPITDLPIALEVHYFRRARDRYLVPVSLKIPGSELRLARASGAETTRLDFIGQVRDSRGNLVGAVRDHIAVRLRDTLARELPQRHLQYDTVFTLPPGQYRLKFVARENVTGKLGTFETRFRIPDLDDEERYLRISSVVWANQRQPLKDAVGVAERSKRLLSRHPLVMGEQKLVPSITKVFRRDQTLYVYCEVYRPVPSLPADPVPVAANLAFYQEDRKVWESEPVEVRPGEQAGAVLRLQLEAPLSVLPPGRYVCQLNVIDKGQKKFAFSRTPLVVLPERAIRSAASQPTRPGD